MLGKHYKNSSYSLSREKITQNSWDSWDIFQWTDLGKQELEMGWT